MPKMGRELMKDTLEQVSRLSEIKIKVVLEKEIKLWENIKIMKGKFRKKRMIMSRLNNNLKVIKNCLRRKNPLKKVKIRKKNYLMMTSLS